MGKKIDI